MSFLFLKDLLSSLIYAKLRTVFSVLAIVFGVASLVLIVSAVKGSNLLADKVIQKLGPDSVLIVSGAIGKGPKGRTRNLDMKDVENVSKLEGIYALTYGIVKPMTVSSFKTSKFSAVFGVGDNWLQSWGYKIETGRGFTKEDFKNLSKVAIVGHDVSDYLFPKASVGKTILIGKVPFKIIGVYKRKGKTPNGHNLDNRVFIPYGVFDRVVDKTYQKVSVIRFRVVDLKRYEEIVKETKNLLLKRHKKDDFTVITPVVVKKFLSMMSATFALFLGIASSVALIVGGFVLSSIFYINVKVREWEIGLRKALGASKKEILLRILSESVVIALISVVIGSGVGFFSVKYLLPSLKVPVVYPIEAFIVASVFSLIVCLVAAYFPSKKAANLEPITSLRRKL